MTTAGSLTPVNPGDVLSGKYEIERVLGSGGMGVVVAVRHIHLGERFAIKFLLPQALKKAEVKERFLREARAAVRIKSEHVARVFDVGTLDDGAPYMVMELLEGSDLSSILKSRGSVPFALAVDYVLQTCEAIAEAHSLGIIHRDLKPANLFVTKRADGSPAVKVIDFGISKVAEAEGEVEMTKTDVMMGSPVYMAPEQMISARDVDVRADVWSLGVILFYLVMGVQPFRGNTVTQLYASILEGPPLLRAQRPDVPAGLEAAIVKCLHANPKDRWSNVAELALAIADFGSPSARVSADRVARTLGVTPAPRSEPIPPGPITPTALAATALLAAHDAAAGAGASNPGVSTGGSNPGVSTGGSNPGVSTGGSNPGVSTGGPVSGTTPSPRPDSAAPPPVATIGPQHTEGSWSGTQAPQQRPRSRALWLAAVVVSVAAAAGAGAVLLIGPGAGPAATPDAASTASTFLPAPPVSGGTTVSPAPTGDAPSPSPNTPTPSSGDPTAPPPSAALPSPTASTTSTLRPSISAKPTGPAPTPRTTAAPRPTATATKSKTDLFSDPH